MNALTRHLLIAVSCISLLTIAGCKEKPTAKCDRCGVVESIVERPVKGEGTGVGAIAGAVIGGVIGHQFGSGRGNGAATVAGAAGGAIAGNEIEKNRTKTLLYDVTIRMDTGVKRTLTFDTPPPVREGDKVEVTGNAIERIA